MEGTEDDLAEEEEDEDEEDEGLEGGEETDNVSSFSKFLSRYSSFGGICLFFNSWNISRHFQFCIKTTFVQLSTEVRKPRRKRELRAGLLKERTFKRIFVTASVLKRGQILIKVSYSIFVIFVHLLLFTFSPIDGTK